MNIIISCRRWFKARRFGLNFFRTKDFEFPTSLNIYNKHRSLYFPNNSTYIELFKEIILDDEYKLSFFKDILKKR